MANQTDGSSGHPHRNAPVFILGILPRSGTGYLSQLLCMHPDCGAPLPIREDFVVHQADWLERYVEAVADHWNPKWGVDASHRKRLLAHLGEGLVSFLSAQAGSGRLVTKTPRVDNLDRFFKLFPDSYLLILVRDGRAVVESGVKSFGWYRDSAIHKWAQAARTILEFSEANSENETERKFRVVRYEDLWANQQEEFREILEFLDLEVSAFDFDAASNLPIRGSSTVRETGTGRMHWDPVEKTADFDPMSRWRHWRRPQHERFNWVAGQYLEPLGYEPVHFGSNRTFWCLWNLVLDLRWFFARNLGPTILKLKDRLGKRKQGAPPSKRSDK